MNTITKKPTQKERILEMLRWHGVMGVTSRDLNSIAYRYSARLEELRKDGYDIKTIQIKRGLFRYILVAS